MGEIACKGTSSESVTIRYQRFVSQREISLVVPEPQKSGAALVPSPVAAGEGTKSGARLLRGVVPGAELGGEAGVGEGGEQGVLFLH